MDTAPDDMLVLSFTDGRKPQRIRASKLFEIARDIDSAIACLKMLMGGPAATVTFQPKPGTSQAAQKVQILTASRFNPESVNNTA